MKFKILISGQKIIKWLSVFLLGIVTGATIINIIIGKNLDKAYIENQDLAGLVEDQKAHIESLESELGASRVILVKEIKIYVLHKDKFVRIETEKIVKDLVSDLIGKEIESLNPILVTNILDNRTIEIDNVTYTLKVKALLISETILIYIEPQEK